MSFKVLLQMFLLDCVSVFKCEFVKFYQCIGKLQETERKKKNT